MIQTLYDILDVRPTASFEDIKAAYYKQAKLCHPDLNGDTPEMTAAFQRLVNAFDILSDPSTRRKYDEQRAAMEAPPVPESNHFHAGEHSIMDTIADDILEELVVGNSVTWQTTLQTLMLDLTRTEHFIMFREAKVAFAAGKMQHCRNLCEKLVGYSPANILYHYYLAESAQRLGHVMQALMHYRRCLVIAYNRMPPQRLERVRRHYTTLLQKQGYIGKFLAWMHGAPPQKAESEEERSQRILNSMFSKELQRQNRDSNKRITGKDNSRKLLK